jgi:hypothetical protein
MKLFTFQIQVCDPQSCFKKGCELLMLSSMDVRMTNSLHCWQKSYRSMNQKGRSLRRAMLHLDVSAHSSTCWTETYREKRFIKRPCLMYLL